MRNFFIVAMAALSLTACRQNDSLATWGMPQPFFNDDDVDLGSRNCGGFFGSWTKYFF